MTAHHFPPPPRRASRPLSVWPTGQQDAPHQLAHGAYAPETAQDAARIPPAIAAHAIATYTHPGETVLDPDCGAGTVLVEALRAQRHAIGITRHHRWRVIARANIHAAHHDGADTHGTVLDALPNASTTHLAGLADQCGLILTTWRTRTRADEPVTGHADTQPDQGATSRLQALLAGSMPLLRPGGHVIVIVPRRRCRGYLPDLPGHLANAGRAMGLLPVERCVALLAELRGSRLVVRASLAQRRSTARHERAIGKPVMLSAHHDVVIFQAPQPAAAPARSCSPPAPLPPRHHPPVDASQGRAAA